MSPNSFANHFADHAASALARQMALGDVLGQRPWDIDMQKGTLRFGEDLVFPIQLLGSHAFEAGSWLWIWANTQSNIPPEHTEAALRIRQIGEAESIEEFTQPALQLDPVTDHMIAMTCGGLQGGRCYYRAPYTGGAVFVLLDNVPPEVTAPVPVARAVTVLTECIAQFELKDHRRLVESFLKQQAFNVTAASPTDIAAERPGEGSVEISFDGLGRISNIAGTLKAQKPAPKTPWWQFWKAARA